MSATATQLMTAEEFVRDYGSTDGVELDQGHLVRTAMPTGLHGEICGNAYRLICSFAKSQQLGRCCTNDTFVRVRSNPDSYRGADVLFISYAKLPKNQHTPDTPFEIMPELVVEVRSKTDRLKKVIDKGQEYLEAGVNVVMIIDPDTESLALFRADELPIRFHNGDIVTIPDVLPGFEAPVKAFFE